MTIGNTPLDLGSIPLGTVISPDNTGQVSGGNVIPQPLQGHPGSFIDGGGNPSTAAMMSFLYPRIVQSGHAVTGSGAKTLTFTFANNNNQGNSIVVCMSMGEVEAANITLAVTDSAGGGGGNTYQKATSAFQSTTLEPAIFFATYIKAGANVVTVTIAGSSSVTTAIGMHVYEVSGLIALANSALDATGTGSNAGSTAVTTSTVVPVAPNEIAFMAVAAAGGTITAASGWTSDTGGALSPTGGNLVSFESQSQFLSTVTSIIPAATLGKSNAWAACCATFKSVIVPTQGTLILPSIVSSVNSSTATLTANSVFTGSSEVALNFSALSVTVFADQASAAGGLSIQQSQNGTNWDIADTFSVVASTVYQTTINLVGQYFRVVYTNGGTNQGAFRLQTIKQPIDETLPRTLTALGNLKVATQEPLPAGTNVIGHVITDSGSVTAATQSGTWTVQPGNTPNTSAWLVQDVVASANGAVPYHNITAATTNFTNVKAAAGQLYGCDLSNTSASAIYVKFYDKATTPATTDTPIRTIQVPANTDVLRVYPKGLKFANGFGWAATGAVANNDNTAIAANCVVDFDLNS